MTDLTKRLDEIRRTVLKAVDVEGPDAHQIAIDNLAWAYAHTQAAVALNDWADLTGHAVARSMAQAAQRQAALFMGASRFSSVDLDYQLAELANTYVPLEDIGASQEERLVRATVREFAVREVAPRAADIHRRDLDTPEEVIFGAAKLGLFGLSVPPEFGGSATGQDVRTMLIVTEELARASLAIGGSLITRPEILVRALLGGGTAEQQHRWLPPIASGDKLVAVAVTEADYGSDVAGIACRAQRLESGDWEINGTKLWCTFAGRAELLMVLCRTADRGHRGLSIFVVDKPRFQGHEFTYTQATGGILRGRAIPTIGYRGLHTFELTFEGFRVQQSSLLGGEKGIDRGFYLQMQGFSMGRIQTAARAVGVMQAAVEDAMSYARARVVFGRPIFENRLTKSRIGRMLLQLTASRQLSYRAARKLENGGGETEASLAKLYASRVAESVTREAQQIFGAMGYSEETNISRYFVDSRVLTIFEGTEEVLSLRVVGRALLAGRD